MPKRKRGRKRISSIPEPLDHQRAEPYCIHFSHCGGCTLQHFTYPAQLELKQEHVNIAFARDWQDILPDPEPILPAPAERGYRNKLEYTFSRRRWLTPEEIAGGEDFLFRDGAGFHVRGFYDRVLDLEECHHQPEPSNRLRLFVRDTARELGLSFYDIAANEGDLRTLTVRTTLDGQVMAIVMFGSSLEDRHEALLARILDSFPELTSLYYIINTTKNSSPIGHNQILHAGNEVIIERCGPLQLAVHPASFFQTNSAQAENLYSLVAEWADLDGSQTLYDLYSGIGSIGLFLASRAGKVIGIEVIEDAVAGARENARINSISNAEFFAGEAEKVCSPDFFAAQGAPDLIVLDPPRPGLHKNLIASLREIRCPRIIYVSCNAGTQADDLEQLQDMYRIVRRRAVDMFPQTLHVENVVELSLK
ncbi:MAG: 23S rRNA (uracil(1939)-C(5))-methyltransferase RlmD [Spirochaeta sp.]